MKLCYSAMRLGRELWECGEEPDLSGVFSKLYLGGCALFVSDSSEIFIVFDILALLVVI